MVGEDRVTMSGKELRRVHVIRQVRDKRITQGEAGTLLGVTDRQIRRLLRRVEQEGDQGLVHRGRGKPSNRRIAEPVKAKVLRLYETRYGDFGPTWRWRGWPRGIGSRSAQRRCGAGYGGGGLIISPAASGRIARGERASACGRPGPARWVAP